jgi:indolepyruvate ferredoxin oxidoreductase beta subunit
MPVVIGVAQYPENIIEDIEKNHTVYRADATKIALELGNPRCFNVVILGMAARHMDYKVEDWYNIIEKTVKPSTIEVNKKAFDAGYNLK